MTVMEFFGCTFIAFGPPFAMFVFTIAKDPVRIIILIASAFFWLLSLLITALWWFIVYPLRDQLAFGVIFSVFFQEIFRYLIYILLKKAEGGLKKVTADAHTQLTDNKHTLAYVAGLGFGIMSGAFSIVNVLAGSVGPGTVGIKMTEGKAGDSPIFIVTSALTTLCFICLHTVWGVSFFHAIDNRNKCLLASVVISHLAASSLTLMNTWNWYWATILPNYLILLVWTGIAFRVAGGRLSKEIFRL